MTKTHRHNVSSAEESFHKHYAAIWGQDRWQASLYPALLRPTRYSCLLNRYIRLDEAREGIQDAECDDKPLQLPQLASTHEQSQAPNLLVRCRRTTTSTSPPDAPVHAQFPPPLSTPGKLQTHWNLDAASVLVAHLLQVQHGDNVLDLCAAPGGKSLALAQNLWVHLHGDDTALKHDTLHRRPLKIGTLHANEVDATRQRRLAENLQSYLPPGLFPSRHIAALRVDGTRPKSLYDLCVQTPSGTVAYDKVLVDAPCSSERHVIHAHAQASARGALAPEMGSWRAGTSKRLAAIQLQLLLAGLKAVRVGGTVMYATCSIEPTENDEVIAKMVKEVEKERKKGVRWRVAIGFEGGDGDASLEKELEEGWAERTKYGWIVLPDHPAGGAWGPLYFVVLTKLAG